MRTGMKLTIQDYFRQSGHQGIRAPRRTDAPPRSGTFSQALDAAQSVSSPNRNGLTLRDYMRSPVQVKAVVPTRVMDTETKGPVPPTPVKASSGKVPDARPNDSVNHAARLEPEGLESGCLNEKDQILASIDRAAKKYELPKALIRAVVQAESDYQVRAVSPAGAQGLMQLMPATAEELGVQDPFDIDQNIHGGAKYLQSMLTRFNGDIKLALSAYNAGPGTVDRYNGNVPYAETRAYVQRVMRFARRFS